MEFDIIDISDEDIKKLTVVQMKMLRTAQGKKDELYHKMQLDHKMYATILLTAGMKKSTLLTDKWKDMYEEFEYKCAVIADNLIYNMSLNEPTSGDDMGEQGGDEGAGYIVDYSLSYNERYVIVRDYYLAIADPAERMALYSADEVAKKYLGSYYGTLYNVLATYSK